MVTHTMGVENWLGFQTTQMTGEEWQCTCRTSAETLHQRLMERSALPAAIHLPSRHVMVSSYKYHLRR